MDVRKRWKSNRSNEASSGCIKSKKQKLLNKQRKSDKFRALLKEDVKQTQSGCLIKWNWVSDYNQIQTFALKCITIRYQMENVDNSVERGQCKFNWSSSKGWTEGHISEKAEKIQLVCTWIRLWRTGVTSIPPNSTLIFWCGSIGRQSKSENNG